MAEKQKEESDSEDEMEDSSEEEIFFDANSSPVVSSSLAFLRQAPVVHLHVHNIGGVTSILNHSSGSFNIHRSHINEVTLETSRGALDETGKDADHKENERIHESATINACSPFEQSADHPQALTESTSLRQTDSNPAGAVAEPSTSLQEDSTPVQGEAVVAAVQIHTRAGKDKVSSHDSKPIVLPSLDVSPGDRKNQAQQPPQLESSSDVSAGDVSWPESSSVQRESDSNQIKPVQESPDTSTSEQQESTSVQEDPLLVEELPTPHEKPIKSVHSDSDADEERPRTTDQELCPQVEELVLTPEASGLPEYKSTSKQFFPEIIDEKKCINIKAQILSDEEYLCPHLLLWVGNIDLSKYKGFFKSLLEPWQMPVNPDDVIYFRFATDKQHPYFIGKEKEKSIKARHVGRVKCINFPFTVNPGPHKIMDLFIDGNCHIHINSLKEELLPFRIKNLAKHDNATSFWIYNQLFIDEKTSCIECVFWRDSINFAAKLSEDVKRPREPYRFTVKAVDSLSFQFLTKEGDPTYTMNEEAEYTVRANDFMDHLPPYKIYSFRVESGSDEIDHKEINVDYHVKGKSSHFNLLLRFTNWKKPEHASGSCTGTYVTLIDASHGDRSNTIKNLVAGGILNEKYDNSELHMDSGKTT